MKLSYYDIVRELGEAMALLDPCKWEWSRDKILKYASNVVEWPGTYIKSPIATHRNRPWVSLWTSQEGEGDYFYCLGLWSSVLEQDIGIGWGPTPSEALKDLMQEAPKQF